MAHAAFAQAVDTTMYGFSPGDRVLAIARSDNTIYLGGSFLYVGPCTGSGVPVDRRSAEAVTQFPHVIGEVDAVVADAQGGWYVGGQFSFVGGQPRTNLAHILADGQVSDWTPNPDLAVRALTLVGSTLYAGGDFNVVGGLPRAHLVALSPGSDMPLPWACDANSRVTALAASGANLYIAGWFGLVAGEPRSYLAAVDLQSGSVLPWQVDLDDRASSLAIADTTLYVGGYFTAANGQAHQSICAVGATTGVVHPWDAGLQRLPISSLDFGPHVNALLLSGQTILVGGSFSRIGGAARRGLAQLDLSTGLATAWDPRATRQTLLGPEFFSMVRSGDTLFVAGTFDSLAGVAGRAGGNAAALSLTSSGRFGWDPNPNDFVFALALQGNSLYLGGRYTSLGDWVERRGLAAIDATTGKVTNWNPAPDDYVKCLTVSGSKVYVGGYFTHVGGQARSFIAALDPVTGEALPWRPEADAPVWTLATYSSTVIAGGLFGSIGGAPLRSLAALDTTNGLATNWNPNAGGDVYALAVSDSAIYVGGDFLSMGGQARVSLAALDPLSGSATPWNPGTDGSVYAMALGQSTIYVGGYFHAVGTEPRSFLAAVDRHGVVTDWAPDPTGPNDDGRVQALAVSDSTVFAGGFFSNVAGEPREYFAALDARTASVRTDYPTVNGPVWALHSSSNITYVGGGFGRVGRWTQACFGAIGPLPGQTLPLSSRLALSQCAPHPVVDATLIRYSLPTAATVTLTIYDLQGRTKARLLSRVTQSAGPHEVPFAATELRPGCYLYRLEAGALTATRKMVVVR